MRTVYVTGIPTVVHIAKAILILRLFIRVVKNLKVPFFALQLSFETCMLNQLTEQKHRWRSVHPFQTAYPLNSTKNELI